MKNDNTDYVTGAPTARSRAPNSLCAHDAHMRLQRETLDGSAVLFFLPVQSHVDPIPNPICGVYV